MSLTTPAMVGRDREYATLEAALVDPAALVLVEGEPGIGKSRLVSECLDAPRLRERQVLLVAFPPLREPFPLGALVDGVRRMREQVGDVRLTPLAGALRPLFPEWSAQLPPAPEPFDDPRATRHRLFRALAELVAGLGAELVVVEDAHWADPATLEWLLTVQSAGTLRASTVVTYRPADVPESSLLRRLGSQTTAGRSPLRIELGPLDESQTSRLVASMLPGGTVPEGFAAFVHRSTEGVPLGAEESVRLLAERYDIAGGDQQWTRQDLADLAVPPTVRDLVLERVRRLPDGARRVLDAAAVLAEPAAEELLARVADVTEEAARRGVTAALTSGLLAEAAPYGFVFRHVLHAKAVEEAIPVPQRRLLDRRAALALEELEHPPAVRLCRHYQRAGDVAAWRRHAETSARLALASGDHHAAVTLLLELLTSAEHPPEPRARLLRLLGSAATRSPKPLGALLASVRELLEREVAGPDIPAAERGEIRMLLGQLFYHCGEFEAAGVQVQVAVEDLADRPDSAARAMFLLAAPEVSRTWTVRQHLTWNERATELLPRVESPLDRRELAIERVITLLHLGESAGWGEATEIPRVPRTPAAVRQDVRAHLNIGQYAIAWGYYQRARRTLDNASATLYSTGYLRVADHVKFDGGLLDWYTGSWQSAARIMDEIARAEDVHRLIHLAARSVYGLIDLAHGHPYQAERCLTEIAELAVHGPLIDWAGIFTATALARLRLAGGGTRGATNGGSGGGTHGGGTNGGGANGGGTNGNNGEGTRGATAGGTDGGSGGAGGGDGHGETSTAADRATAVAEALRLTGPVVDAIATRGLWLFATDILPTHIEALVGDGRADDAAVLIGRFAEWVEHRDVPAPAAALATCRGLLAAAGRPADAGRSAEAGRSADDGRPAGATPAEAATLFADAAAAWAALPRPYDELLALERRGRCLLAAGESESGVAVLTEVHRRLGVLGARWDAGRVARTLRRHGAQVGHASRRGRRGYGTQLSPRERQVTALVAEGLTNREIGERLCLATRTVDRHLGGAMRKLGASSRTTLVLLATKAGLIG